MSDRLIPMLETNSGAPSGPSRLIFVWPRAGDVDMRRLVVERVNHEPIAVGSVDNDHLQHNLSVGFFNPTFRRREPDVRPTASLTARPRYARFFSRLRAEISAISIGPTLNCPSPAFRVSSRK
jgi:hypothetical protein